MSEVKLLPCPFCGSDVNDDNSDHIESCYFAAQEEFEKSCGGDISVVLDAWNRRPYFDAQRLRADTAESELKIVRKSRDDELENYNALISDLAAAEQRVAELTALLLSGRKVVSDAVGLVEEWANVLRKRMVDHCSAVDAALNPNPEAESHE
ncbi:hypothetical protein [Pseudomonas koreensis]|uniref:Uncharacterized protein n=1 Tax=Pseudomonas koreensis TaxID=198620 RepID=A0AA94EP18_9PSED|nr:hypothetical protein [Pseudomonas koreensis]RVD77066.1 hypothetical protein A9HBioS_3089 [Pseudomonas koreensis]